MTKSQSQMLRMLAMVPYLQSNTGVPVREMAEQFGVTDRQIRDDLLLLMYTGVGEYGGDLIDVDVTALEEDGIINLRDADFMSRPLRITAQEGAALVVALRTLRAAADTEQAAIIDSALAKIEAALGDAFSAPVDVVVDDVDPQIHRTISQAASSGQRLSLTYANASRDERTEREVDPQRVFTERGRLYVEAWCLRADDIRFFRLDRVLAAEPTGDPVEEHEAEPRDISAGVFTPTAQTDYAVVQIHPSAAWVAETYPVEFIEQDDQGVWTAKLFAADPDWLRRVILRSAGQISVLEPFELRSQSVESARTALAAYDEEVTE